MLLFAVLLGMSLAVTAWAQTPIPQRRGWEAHMLQQGAQDSAIRRIIDAAIGSGGVITEGNVWYYDGARVYDQIAVYTGDPILVNTPARAYSNQAYRDLGSCHEPAGAQVASWGTGWVARVSGRSAERLFGEPVTRTRGTQ